MTTVRIRKKAIPERIRLRAALLCGAVLALGQAMPAGSQELGTLRGEVGEEAYILSRTSGAETAEEGIPEPAYRPLGSIGDIPEEQAAPATAAAETLDLETTASTTGAQSVDEILASEIPEPPGPAKPVGPVAPVQGSGAAPEDDPFAATGLRLGSFPLRPTVELGLTGTRETTGGGDPVNSLFGDTALRLQLDSDWDRHALNVVASGRLQRTLSSSDELEPSVTVDATGRVDIGSDTTLTVTAGYDYLLDDAQSAAFYAATDPLLIPLVTGTNDPATQTLDGALTLRHDFGRHYGEAGISAERSIYGDAELSDGTSVSQHDLDNTVYDARLRAGIEVSPALAPFVEASWGLRRMDVTPDSGGANRNATRYALRLGTAVDLGEKLNGEISAGYIREDIEDAALADLAGLSVDASINWSPRRETGVRLALSTSTDTSGGTGDSGALLYTADLGVTHRIRSNLTAEAGLGADYRNAEGSADEFTLSGTAALTYWFNRFTGLTTRVGHERTMSSDVASRSDKTTAFVGLKLQR